MYPKRQKAETTAQQVFENISSSLDELRGGNDIAMLLGDFNARTGSLSDLPDLELLEGLQREGLGSFDVNGLMQAPLRRNEDIEVNAFGRALLQMCMDKGLLILNGRIMGDTTGKFTFQGPQGNSTIDLFLAPPSLLARARELQVLGLLPGFDHHPVSLDIRVLRKRASSQAKRAVRQPRPRFEHAHWSKYAALFGEGSSTMNKIDATITDLRAGRIACAEAVEALMDTLYKGLAAVFPAKRKEDRIEVEGRLHKPWWNADCDRAREELMRFLSFRHHVVREWQVCHPDGHMDAFATMRLRELRAKYARVQRMAQEQERINKMQDFVSSCRTNPRNLWQKLNGQVHEPCPISDTAQWTEHCNQLLNAGAQGLDFNDGLANLLFNKIHFGLGVDTEKGEAAYTPLWKDCDKVRARRQAAIDCMLHAPFSMDEVLEVVGAMKNNKSSGLECTPAECYKYACREFEDGSMANVLIPSIQAIMEHIRSTGDFPRQFTVFPVTPIFKKGDPQQMNNYRGLAVGGALFKCYTSLLERRLSRWLERNGLRSVAQAGFRSKLGTCDHLFTLRHLMHKYKRWNEGGISKRLRICQIDFEKAFDKVQWGLLFKRLEEQGTEGSMLDAIKKSYEKVSMRVKVNGKLGVEFPCRQGVKQGDPLSVVLFGVFIEVLAEFLDRTCLDKGLSVPNLDGRPTPCLLYADDISLLALGDDCMHELLRAVDEFCACMHMKVNVAKTEVLYISPAAWGPSNAQAFSDFSLGSPPQPIKRAHVAKYLGVTYGSEKDFSACTAELCAAGRKAMYALLAKLKDRRFHTPSVMLSCFDAQVRAVLSYACQVWAPDMLNKGLSFSNALEDPMVLVQKEFLKQVVGAKLPPCALLFQECGQMPLHFHWAKLVLKFWNSLVSRPDILAHKAFRDDIRGAIADNPINPHMTHGSTWVALVLRFLYSLGFSYGEHAPQEVESRVDYFAKLSLPVGCILNAYGKLLRKEWGGQHLDVEPRDFVSRDKVKGELGVKACRYVRWMGGCSDPEAEWSLPTHASVYIPQPHHQCLMRFRLGCWALNAGRATDLPRSARVCKLCSMEVVEDELHVVLECTAYASVRAQHGLTLGLGSVGLQALMTCSAQRDVAHMLFDIHQLRATMLNST
mgnify:CR=1 FL=1